MASHVTAPDIWQVQHDLNRTALDLLRADLSTGILLAEIAETARTEEKRARICAKARRTYDDIVRLSNRVSFSPSEWVQFRRRLLQLRSKLRHIGVWVGRPEPGPVRSSSRRS